MIGSTDWAGLAGFVIAVATLIPVLVTAFLQIKQNAKVNEVHSAVTPVNGEPPINQQVTETNAIAHDVQQTVSDVKSVVENHPPSNGGTT